MRRQKRLDKLNNGGQSLPKPEAATCAGRPRTA